MKDFKVANVVGTITYQQELNLEALAETFSSRSEFVDVTYEPAENHWLQAWLAPGETYVPFYRGGKCSIVGAKSLDDFYEVADKVNAIMRDILGFEYEPVVELKNVVATAELGTIPSLETLAIGLGLESVEYEPEQFPALIYREDDFVLLVFSSGKLVCTGLTDPAEISIAFENLTKDIKKLS